MENDETLQKEGNIKEDKVKLEEEDKQQGEGDNSSLQSQEDKKEEEGKNKEKINIRLNPVGNAPILKQKLWSVPADREVGQIIEFVKKYLKLEKHQSLFLFVNQAFAPCPDQPLKELYECFGSDGKLVFHYSTTFAWG